MRDSGNRLGYSGDLIGINGPELSRKISPRPFTTLEKCLSFVNDGTKSIKLEQREFENTTVEK